MRQHLITGVSLCALFCAISGFARAAEAEAAEVAQVDEVVVYGQGQARQVQVIRPVELLELAPGTSPIKAVEKLPGVNFQSADAFGAYEWSTRISIRGFNQNQLGFTLDGVPLGDMSYGNFNGLHISRAIATEDLGNIELAQGAGALETASTSNLGGTLKFVSRVPSQIFGVLAAATVGSDSMYRVFVRADSGVLPSGGRGYLSYANQSTDKWKGDGEQKQQQVDVKFVQPIGPASLTGFYDWSRRRENDYQDLSLGMIRRLGYNWDNISGSYATALRIADIFQANPGGDCTTNAYPAPVKCVDDAYFDASGLRDDKLWSVILAGPVTGALNASAQVYGHQNDGQGLWFTPYVPSPQAFAPGATTANAPISIRTTEYAIDRKGVIVGAEYRLASHAFSAGGWYEDNDFDQARRYYALNRASQNRDSLDFQSGPFQTDWAYSFNTKTQTAYLQDVWTVTDALKANFGFKAEKVEITSRTVTGSPVINGSITSKDSFLPQLGVTYRLNDMGEVFGGYTENIRAFGAAHTGASPFATTQAGFNALKGRLKPETSKTFEGGYRFHTDTLQGVVAVYYVKFDNRIIATAAGAGIVGNPSILANAGSVTSKGFEAAGTWRITDAVSVFASYAYDDSTYDDDVKDPAGTLVARISGKETVDTPKNLLKVELSFEQNGWFAKAAAHYTSQRFFTYTNDQKVPGYTLVDLSAGYRFGDSGWAKGLEVQGNVTNLFDKAYVSTIGSNGFGYSGDNQTLLAGAPRQFFFSVRKQF